MAADLRSEVVINYITSNYIRPTRTYTPLEIPLSFVEHLAYAFRSLSRVSQHGDQERKLSGRSF